MGDVGEGPTVDECRIPLQRLNKVRKEGIPEQEGPLPRVALQ